MGSCVAVIISSSSKVNHRRKVWSRTNESQHTKVLVFVVMLTALVYKGWGISCTIDRALQGLALLFI